MSEPVSRRDFLSRAATGLSATALVPAWLAASSSVKFKVSLAEWSFHRAIRSGAMRHLDFARLARAEFGIRAVEYVNQFFPDKVKDNAYLAEMNKRANDEGVFQHLIMIDVDERLGDPDAAKRTLAVERHMEWMDAAKQLGCPTIRVNADSEGTPEQQLDFNADGLHRLAEYGGDIGMNVVVENHGGMSSNGQWVAALMKRVNHKRLGTLPDFGNFDLGNGERYDAYRGVMEMLPFAKAVSAKSHDFDSAGNETSKDYYRLMKSVVDSGYRGWIGIEYEGEKLSEKEGVAATLRLLERVGNQL